MRGAWKAPFLACLRRCGKETNCAELVGVSRQHVARTKRREPSFAEDVSAALATYQSTVVEEALRRQRRYAVE